MDPLTLLVIAGSMLAKHMASQGALNRQEQLRGSMEAYQRSKAQDTEQAINNLVQNQTPQARSSELADLTNQREQSMRKTVNAAQATEAAPLEGKLSSDYAAAQERSANTVADRTKRAIQQLATMGAPGEAGLKQSIRLGRTAGDVDANNRAIDYVGNAFTRDMDNVRPNPWLSMIGDVGTTVGGSMLAGNLSSSGAGAGAQPNLVSPNNTDWGSLDAGPGAYSTRRARVGNAFSLWGRGP